MSRIRGRGALGEVGGHSLHGGLTCKQAGVSRTCREAGRPGQQWTPGRRELVVVDKTPPSCLKAGGKPQRVLSPGEGGNQVLTRDEKQSNSGYVWEVASGISRGCGDGASKTPPGCALSASCSGTSLAGWSQGRRESVLAALTPAKGSRVSSGMDLSGAEPRRSWDCPVFPREHQPPEGSRCLVPRTATPGPCPNRCTRNMTHSLQEQRGCLPSGKGGRRGLGIPAHCCQVHLSESTAQALGEARVRPPGFRSQGPTS